MPDHSYAIRLINDRLAELRRGKRDVCQQCEAKRRQDTRSERAALMASLRVLVAIK